jgi:hypothetical protein
MDPDVAPDGMVTAIDVSLQRLIVTGKSLRVAILLPCDAPNPDPLIITWVPTGPVVADSELITGAGFAWVLNDTSSNVTVPPLPVPHSPT